MTDKSAAAIREFAYKHAEPKVTRNSYGEPDISPDANKINAMLSDLTALISEHYVSREEYKELLRQRDELKEALINVMVVVRDCYPLLFDNEKPAVKQAEAAIKSTETK